MVIQLMEIYTIFVMKLHPFDHRYHVVIDSLATRQPDSSARDMEELADYFSQRLANCQRQVYNVVNQVQSQVGPESSAQNASQVRFFNLNYHDWLKMTHLWLEKVTKNLI